MNTQLGYEGFGYDDPALDEEPTAPVGACAFCGSTELALLGLLGSLLWLRCIHCGTETSIAQVSDGS